jgi:hypothetical protein
VEKTVDLQGFQEVYKARNINVLLSQCSPQRNGSALWWAARNAIYPMQWTSLMICCGVAVKRMVIIGVSGKWRYCEDGDGDTDW